LEPRGASTRHMDEVEDLRAVRGWRARTVVEGAYTCSDMKFTRITVRPDVCTGKPCIRDLRFPVSRLLGLLAARQTPDEILRAYPYLEAADIDEALRYAASLAEDETIELVG
jgi:uncharacterized protein (DUF433 family)